MLINTIRSSENFKNGHETKLCFQANDFVKAAFIEIYSMVDSHQNFDILSDIQKISLPNDPHHV